MVNVGIKLDMYIIYFAKCFLHSKPWSITVIYYCFVIVINNNNWYSEEVAQGQAINSWQDQGECLDYAMLLQKRNECGYSKSTNGKGRTC